MWVVLLTGLSLIVWDPPFFPRLLVVVPLLNFFLVYCPWFFESFFFPVFWGSFQDSIVPGPLGSPPSLEASFPRRESFSSCGPPPSVMGS